MARLARVVIPGVPHHVTQRGNRRDRTFFEDADYALYRDLLGEAAGKAGAEVWAYCLMPNHVHVILTPSDPDGLRRTFAELHRRYTGIINARHRWTGNYGDSLLISPTSLSQSHGAPGKSRDPRCPAPRDAAW